MERARKVEELGDERAEPVDLGGNVAGKLAREFVGCLQFLGQHFGGAFDDSERVANLMR